ncbi:hypothetical protein ACGFNF_16035 [Micromonospora sp. NPDC048868]|uniref:hypothetical protein n=1 Tax=Micromonospora sp. NPDC048868 TaxID=3364258 RepID=UPI0037112B2B
MGDSAVQVCGAAAHHGCERGAEVISACTLDDMTSDMRENALPKDMQEDLAELDFAPITNEEAFKVEDRTYLFGVHVDNVRG